MAEKTPRSNAQIVIDMLKGTLGQALEGIDDRLKLYNSQVL